MATETLRCPHCGTARDERDLHTRFKLSDPVLRLRRTRRVQYEGADIITVPHVGSFARVLLPITLTGGYQLTIGTWLGLDEQAMYERAVELWNSSRYAELRLEGRLVRQPKIVISSLD